MVLAAHASSPYTGAVVWFALIAGGLFLLSGLAYSLLFEIPADKETKNAAKQAAKDSKDPKKTEDGKVDAQAQGAVVDTVKAVADLAGSLKGLTVGARLAMIGVFLVALAAVASGADALGDASKDKPTPPTSGHTQMHHPAPPPNRPHR